MTECKHAELKAEWNDNTECYQHIITCKLSKKPCQGTDGVCVKFEAIPEPQEKKVAKKKTQTAEAEEKLEETQEELAL